MASWNELLRAARKRSGLGQQALAGQAEVSLETLSHYERGKGKPTRDTLLKLTAGLGLDTQATNELLAETGFDPLPTGRPATFERRSLPVTTLQQEIDSYSWPCLVANDQMEILLANPPANWVAERDLQKAIPKLRQRHPMRLAALSRFRERVDNWDEVVSVMIAFFKTDFEDPEQYAAAAPWFNRLLQDLRTKPQYRDAYPRIVELWQEATALRDMGRTTFPARWRARDGTLLSFEAVLSVWHDFDAYYVSDWYPADATTVQWLQQARAQNVAPARYVATEERQPSPLPSWSVLLQRKRSQCGFSQDALARAAGISPAAVYSYEAGRRKPTRQVVLRLARAMMLDGDGANRLLREAGLAPVATDVARSIVGLPTTNPRYRLGRLEALAPRTLYVLPQRVRAHAWPCLVVDSRCQVLAWNGPAVQVLGHEPRGENLLRLVLSLSFREQALNYDEVTMALASSGLREALLNGGESQGSVPLLPVIESLREEDPEAAARLESA